MAQRQYDWPLGTEHFDIAGAVNIDNIGLADIRLIVKDDNVKRDDVIAGLKALEIFILNDPDFLPQ